MKAARDITDVSITPRLFASRFMTSGVGILLAAIHGFISIPIYTGFLEVSEYGILRIGMLTVSMLQAFFSFRLINSVGVYSADLKDKTIASANFLTGLLGSLISMAVCTAIYLLVFKRVLPSEIHPYMLHILMMIYGFVLMNYVISFIGIFQLILQRTLANLAHVYGTMAVAIILLYRGGNVETIFIAYAATSFAVFFIMLVYAVRMTGVTWKWEPGNLWKFVKFAAPLIPVSMSGFMIQNLDQYFILHYMNESAVAIYSVSVSLVAYIQQFLGAFFTTYLPTLYRLWGTGEQERFWKYTRKATHLVTLFFGYSLVGLALYAPTLIRILTRKQELWEASVYVIPLGAALIGAVLGRTMLPYFYTQKDSTTSLWVHLGGAAMNSILNIILIPDYGIMGAVWATVLTYATYLIAIILLVYRASGVMYDFGFLLRAIAATAPVVYCADHYIAYGTNIAVKIAWGLPVLAAYTALLAALRCISREDIDLVKGFISRKKKKQKEDQD